jgi:23S rRNA (guanosine2251-2'-O)-methyltransferase
MSSPRTIITGFHAIEEVLKRPATGGVLYLTGDRKRNRALRELASERGVRVVEASGEELSRLSGGGDPRGAVYLRDREPLARSDLRSELGRLQGGKRLLLLLDHIFDPHNLGAILRSADQFAVDLVILPERRAAQVTPAVSRASAGASAHVPVAVVANLASAMRLLREAEFWIYGAHLRGERLDRTRFPERTAVVLGSEGHGLAELVARECDTLLRIPSAGRVDSLNVSVAAGILMYEVRRSQAFFPEAASTRGT